MEAISLPLDSVKKEGKVKSVRKMKDGSPLSYKVTGEKLVITLDETPTGADEVIEVVF